MLLFDPAGAPQAEPPVVPALPPANRGPQPAQGHGRKRLPAELPRVRVEYPIEGVREAIEAVGARLAYLPPYSPDFNPIEQVFAKLKALLRKHAERTVEGLWNRVGALIDEFSPCECRNYLRHCGYALQ